MPKKKPTLQVYSNVTSHALPIVALEQIKKNTFNIFIAKESKELPSWHRGFSFLKHLDDTTKLTPYILPEWDTEDLDIAQSIETGYEWISTLAHLLTIKEENGPSLIITTLEALKKRFPSPYLIKSKQLNLNKNQRYSFDQLRDDLATKLDYDCEKLCEAPGQFSIRGGLIDIYPINANEPYRIDFFGDDIESIRTFDPITQRSNEELEQINILASPKEILKSQDATILDFLPQMINWITDDITVFTGEDQPLFQNSHDRNTFHSYSSTDEIYKPPLYTISNHSIDTESLELYTAPLLNQMGGIERLEWVQKAQMNLIKQLETWHKQNHNIHIVLTSDCEKDRLWKTIESHSKALPKYIKYHTASLTHGYRIGHNIFAKQGIIVITSNEIFGRHTQALSIKKKKIGNHAHVDQLLDFSELANGDYVVHLQHGICIYHGIKRMVLDSIEEEVVSLEFDNNITLHLRLHETHLLSRYIGLSKSAPKLGKIGTNSWTKTRRAAENATLDFAAELLRVQANRDIKQGHAFNADTEWQKEFEADFPYKETKDQLQAIQAVKHDMETPHPMDRLICGDVGFGKTEIAIRAIFKAAIEGFQVALLAPTTVLAQQHFNTLCDRFASYPITIDMLSRLRSPKQRTLITQNLNEGKVDIIVGTHSLLSKNIKFQKLGLLIIDEEHRFGVKQKEKIKHLRDTVDVMTMSATPIPRTLQLAFSGVRDLSVIETPPHNRLPVHTIVKNYDPEIIKKAIRFETQRGGQVFYLHNRVDTINTVAASLQRMFPKLNIAVGHGKMNENDLERVMTEFVAGRYDILVCTTIIESGLDIPNSNTIIIEGADKFGLAQLYQIRGRVGRFNRQAYAYLLLHKDAILDGDAKERLNALRQHTQLGAGFRIAMRDLELRGAGNILGAQQSGHIAGVGFDLYCQLLKQSVARLKGEPVAQHIRASLRIDFIAFGTDATEKQLTAFIPEDYIQEPSLRIYMYRQLANADEPQQVFTIKEELVDRFGPIPANVSALLEATLIRCLAQAKGVLCVETEGDKLKCQRAKGKHGDLFVKIGNRFPRLTQKDPLLRLSEIKNFITNINIS